MGVVPQQDERLVSEVVRLRRIDREHRRISEEAEADARTLRCKSRELGHRLEKVAGSLKEDHDQERLWSAVDEIVQMLTKL